MILIADSGSTKTDWRLVGEDGAEAGAWQTAGMNPYFQTEEEMCREIGEHLFPHLAALPVEAVCFYGAGCAFPEKNRRVERAIRRFFPVNIEVGSDLLGAARALCGTEAGIACILGTGSNSCRYDGREIVEHVSPLGYILGDEGSGAVLGKLFVGDCLKRQMPEPLVHRFMQEYNLTAEALLDRVYRQPFPNRFLASLTPFLRAHLDCPEVRRLVLGSFQAFFRRNVLLYAGHRDLPVHLTGSVAFYFREIVSEAAASSGLRLGTVCRTPMAGLVEYHAGASSLV